MNIPRSFNMLPDMTGDHLNYEFYENCDNYEFSQFS